MVALTAFERQPCTTPATVAEVANEFLRLAQEDGQVIDQMKLQKLLFYAHAWHLAYFKGPLFENDVEAWPWGPVIRDAYIQTKDYKRAPITAPLYGFSRTGGFDLVTPQGVDDGLKPFIRSVWDVLKKFSGIQLSNSTHASGEPWSVIADKLGTDNKPTIPNDVIQSIFEQKIVK